MQELRFVAVSEDGSYAVLAVPGRSGRFILPIDERLRAVAMGQTSRLAQYEIEVESPLRPKEIQARIRAGETAEEIADAAGIPVERVRWFEGPVLAERAYIADQAQAASVRRAGDSAGPGARLGDIVPERLAASGAGPEDGVWDSRKRGDGNWQVSLTFPSGGRLHVAEWVFDSRRRHVMPDDDNAARLSLPESELPPEPVAVPGEATVTPLAPRLGAAAGMGGGGMSGGFAGGGSGVGVRSFRPERSVIPDRSLGGERTLVDRPLSPPQAPVHAPTPAAASAPIAPPALPRPTHHDHTAFRDPLPEPPAAYREPAPEPLSYRAQAPEQPAPAPTMPVTAPAYVFDDLPAAALTPPRHVVFEEAEPGFRDEQLELGPTTPHTAPVSAAPISAAPISTVAPAPVAPPTAPSLPQPPAQPDERLRQQEPATVRESAPTIPAAAQSHQAAPVAVTAPAPAAQVPAAQTPSAQEQPTAAALAEPRPVATPAAATSSADLQSRVEPAAHVGPASAPESATVAPAAAVPAAVGAQAPAQPEPTPPAESVTVAAAAVAPAEPVSTPTAPAPAVAESAAVSAATATTPGQPEPIATAEPEPATEPDLAAASAGQVESAEDQSARQRPGSKKNPKGRRSSVPSWDEIMLGSSRQRD